jgi:hypothetical protein
MITFTIGLFIGAFIGFIIAAILAMGKIAGVNASNCFAEWLSAGCLTP